MKIPPVGGEFFHEERPTDMTKLILPLSKFCERVRKLHDYTVHQQYPAIYFASNAHNVKKRRVIKTF